MDRGAASLHGDDGVEHANGSLERLQILVLVWEHTEEAVVHPEADTSVDVLLRGLEPGVALGLRRVSLSLCGRRSGRAKR